MSPNKGYADLSSPPPPFLRSGHLDIKDAQCAETKDVLKISHRVFELWASKRGVMGAQKINFSLKVAKFSGKMEINLTVIFCLNDFFVRLLIFKIWSIFYIFLQNLAEIWRNFFLEGGFVPPAAPLDPPCFRIENSSRNRLASTAYFAKGYATPLLPIVKCKIDNNSKTKNLA